MRRSPETTPVRTRVETETTLPLLRRWAKSEHRSMANLLAIIVEDAVTAWALRQEEETEDDHATP